MKSKYIIGAIAVAATMATTSCDDFLNDNRYPLSQQTVNPEFWSNSVNVQNQVNYFYEDYSGYGNGGGSGSFYWSTLSDDQVGRTAFANWTFTAVPPSSPSYTAPYAEIRRANLIIKGVESSPLPASDKSNFLGLARLHRARSYTDLIHRYNDVPLVKGVVDPGDQEALYGERTPRNEVADYILEDFTFACGNIAKQSSKTELSADLAYAQMMEFCLFEGSWARYHQKDEVRAKKFFEEAVKAGEAIAARYPIGDNYSALYKAAEKELGGIPALSSNAEVIFMKSYSDGVFMNSITDYSCASDGVAGLTKSAFDAFLFVDGKPKAKTSCDNTDLGNPTINEQGETSSIDITNLLAVRDQRLAQITQPALMFPGMSWAASNTVGMWSRSGYGVSKFLNPAMPSTIVNEINKGYLCAPLYWGARLYLGIAEAKAELGTLSDADVAKYIKPLWDRAGIDTSNLNKAWLENMGDPANNMNVSSLIWEIRRCRRCELMLDDNIRYWDLVRWHQLQLLDFTQNPDIALGANVSNSTTLPEYGVKNGYIDASWSQSRAFNDKHYLYPVPQDQLSLNSKLGQNNPGW